MIDEALLEHAAHRFALLADPTRLRLLKALVDGGELNVSAIANAAHTSPFNASQHLSRLSAAGMVARRREGSSAYYRISDPTLPTLCDLVCSSLRKQAAAILAASPGASAKARSRRGSSTSARRVPAARTRPAAGKSLDLLQRSIE